MLADILICLVLIAIVTSIVHSLIKNKKQGKSLCSGACTADFHGRQRASVSRSGATYF